MLKFSGKNKWRKNDQLDSYVTYFKNTPIHPISHVVKKNLSCSCGCGTQTALVTHQETWRTDGEQVL